MYDQFVNVVHQKYPSLAVEGENYPPPAWRLTMAQGLSLLKILLIVAVVSGQNPFPALNMETPNAFTWAMNNKVSCFTLQGRVLADIWKQGVQIEVS